MPEPASTPHPPLRRRATLSGLEKIKVSAVVRITGASPQLERVLSAVGFCDEVLAVASAASEEIRTVCASAGARLADNMPTDVAQPMSWPLARARHDWVLLIEADEVLDYEAATTIQVLDYADPRRAWRIRRRPYLGAREIRFGAWSGDAPVRLFNRTMVDPHEPAHATVAVLPEVALLTLQGSLHRYAFADHAALFESLTLRIRAQVALGDHAWPRLGLWSAVVRALWAFLHSFVIRQGFRDGVAGLLVGMAVATEVVLGPSLAHDRDGGSG